MINDIKNFSVFRILANGDEEQFECDELPRDVHNAPYVSVRMNFAVTKEIIGGYFKKTGES